MPFKKGDAAADAQADLEKLDGQLAKLGARRSDLSLRLDAARAARRDALVAGDFADVAMAAVEKVYADAAEVHGFVEAEITAATAKRAEAQRHLDGLRDAAARAEVIADCQRRSAALDAAAEALAGAAEAFGEARAALATAIGEHGMRIDDMHGLDGGTPVWKLAQPIVSAAIRLAAPGVLPAADAFGDPHVDDPLIAIRRAQSGKLRDHADAVREGKVPAVQMPRPGSTAPVVQPPGLGGPASPVPAGIGMSEPMARTVFAVPVAFAGLGGVSMVQAEPGDMEAPLRVVRKAEEQELSFPPDSDEGRAIVARLKASGGQYRARPPVFIDTSGDADPTPARPSRTITTTWPDERDAGLRA